MTDKHIEKYIVPFYLKADLLATEKKSVLIDLLNSSESILFEFLTEKGWRNRVVASTVIGGMKMEIYIDQIYKQAKELNEFYQGKSYAFALTNMSCEKADKYLEILAHKNIESDYSKNIQRYYKAGLSIRNKDYDAGIDLKNEINKLNSKMEKWKTLPNIGYN